MQYIDIQQNTDEWLDLRVGKITGSSCSKIMANYDKAFGEPAKKAAVTVAVEQITKKRSVNELYSNSQMQRGHDQEPVATALYEAEYFVDIDNGGFFDCGNFGCSPDGLVGNAGLIEVKSVLSNIQYANIKRGGVDPAYKWQLIFNLMKTEREWIDFVSYCADFPIGKKLYVCRTYRSDCEDEFNMIEKRSDQFFQLVDEIKKRIS